MRYSQWLATVTAIIHRNNCSHDLIRAGRENNSLSVRVYVDGGRSEQAYTECMEKGYRVRWSGNGFMVSGRFENGTA